MKNQTPPNLPPVPNDFIYYGKGPLKVKGRNRADHLNIFYYQDGLSPCWSNDKFGDSRGYYALRENSEIAKLNGLTNTETIMKTQTHTKQMKLKLKELDADEIQVPSGMVAFRIVEQEGFANSKIYESDGHAFRSLFLPDFNEKATETTFYLRGLNNDKDNRIMVIPRVKYEKLVKAIDSLLKKENAPKVLYTATFFYKNEKNGSQKRRMIEVLKEDATYLGGNDKDDNGAYKKFLKGNVIGAIDKVK